MVSPPGKLPRLSVLSWPLYALHILEAVKIRRSCEGSEANLTVAYIRWDLKSWAPVTSACVVCSAGQGSEAARARYRTN
jgi:hypothetical protein